MGELFLDEGNISGFIWLMAKQLLTEIVLIKIIMQTSVFQRQVAGHRQETIEAAEIVLVELQTKCSDHIDILISPCLCLQTPPSNGAKSILSPVCPELVHTPPLPDSHSVFELVSSCGLVPWHPFPHSFPLELNPHDSQFTSQDIACPCVHELVSQ